MEFLTMVALINLGAIAFIIWTLYQGYMYRKVIRESAYHHLISHGFIVAWFIVALDVFLFYGYMFPLVFAFLYMLQHVLKENTRLIETGEWTDGVGDD